MIKNIFRTIAIGLLVGVLFFVAFRFIIVLAILVLIFKLSGKGRMKRDHWRNRKFAFADRIRNMETDEYENFKTNYGHSHCDHYYQTNTTTE